jgi:uncharacterized repeat protein (TIGR01451 family)
MAHKQTFTKLQSLSITYKEGNQMTHRQPFRKRPFLSTSALRPLGLALLVVMLIALSVAVAYADTIVVTRTDDVVDAGDCDAITPGDLPGTDGLISLREAICAANNNPFPDTINLGAHTYELSIEGINEDANATGDLDILYGGNDLTIVGEGASNTIIDARQIDRVFQIEPGTSASRTISISGVTIQGGDVDGNGGGIRNDNAKLTIAHSTIYSNTAGGSGGGITNRGPLTITHSIIYSNTAETGGGGIDNQAGRPGDPPTRTASIINSTVFHNRAWQAAGGISNIGTLTIINSTIYSNTSELFGGGIFNHTVGKLTITRSTISDNQAAGVAGGIATEGALTVTNSTISGNRAGDEGGGLHVYGTVSLTHVTITGNSTRNGDGGGVNRAGGTITLKNTIVAGNMDHAVPVAHDCSGTDINTEGDNLVGQNGNANGCPLDAEASVVAGAISTVLDPLADNGGATETHALVAGSPAIDQVTDCTDLAGNLVTADQRGVARPQFFACDIGAYEAAPELSIVKTVTPETDVPYQGFVTYTIVLSNAGLVPGIGVALSDTLPGEVDFAWWIAQPDGANVVSDVITWNDSVPADAPVTFRFVASQTGDYGDVVTNTAEYDHSSGSGSDDATFTVIVVESAFSVYLPIVLKNW